MIIDKRGKEKESVELFKDWYNNFNHGDFQIMDFEEQEIDYLLISSSNKSNKIKLQITTCDHNIILAHCEAKKNPGEVIAFDSMHEQLISKAIIAKSLKYPVSLQKELVLLVWSDMARFNSNYIRKLTNQACKKTSFKEIYLLELPSNKYNKSYPLKEGNVICLKTNLHQS